MMFRLPLVSVLAGALLLAAACGSAPDTPSPSPTPTVGGVASPTPETPAPTPEAPTVKAPDYRVIELLYRITQARATDPGNDDAVAALAEIAESGDPIFLAPLTDLIQVPLTRDEFAFNIEHVIPVMQQLSGQGFEYDGRVWVEWLAGQPDPGLPDGYLEWKVGILSDIDPRFRDYFTTGPDAEIMDIADIDLNLRFLVWGGVLQDDGSSRSIPSLVEPAMVPAAKATYLQGSDRVFGVSINGDSRAYPLRILNWHEMANDVVGGVPVALAYCTLCGSGILYETQQPDGQTYVFRSSGLLYYSNKLMYDLTTRGLWNQFTGIPVTGPLAGSDVRLKVKPVTLTTWADWLSRHPDTKALDIQTGYLRNYASEGEPGAAYTNYYRSPDLWFPVNEYDGRLLPKDVVYGIESDDAAKAWLVGDVAEEGLVNDAVGELNVVLLGNGDTGSVEAFERRSFTFLEKLAEDGQTTLVDSEGGRWVVGPESLVAVGGKGEMPRVSGRTGFWFAWRAFFPQTELYDGDG